jgi:DNA-directed RNA polymerase subunit N (RpoN/RPB10)
MMYLVCPTCKKLLGDKQIILENVFGQIENDLISRKITKEEANDMKREFVMSLGLNRYCCVPRVIKYVQLVKIIK